MCLPHVVAFACQNIHDPYFFLWILHCAFGFLSAELALGIIFLAILSIFTCCESGWLIPPPTKKKHCWYHTSTHNTQPHHQKCHTRQLGSSPAAEVSFAAAGSLGVAAAAQQRSGSDCSLAVAGSLVASAAAQQRGGGSGSSVAAGSLAVAAAVAAAWRKRGRGNGSGSMAAAVAAWWCW